MLAAFGDFEGGVLRYWPDDNKSMKVEMLANKDSLTFDVRTNLILFDGQRCHEVLPFEGERYSLVWFTCARYWEAGKATLKKLSDLGFEVPTEKSIAGVYGALRKPTPDAVKAPKLPGALQWTSDRIAAKDSKRREECSGRKRPICMSSKPPDAQVPKRRRVGSN